MKKILALTLVLIMALSLATTAFAADITIDDGKVEGAEYEAYKLLNATDGGNGKFAYTVNPTYLAALRAIVGAEATEDAIVAYIAALKDNATGIRTFADAIYAQVKDMDADYTTKTNVFSNVDQGYYLIVETETGSADEFEEDTFSLVMLDTAGKDSITIKTKEELPQSEKKVMDTNDSTGATTDWQDSADHDIGDKVPFQITFTLPKDYAVYKKYFVGVHDVQAEGLTYNKDMKVTVNGTVITSWFEDTEETDDECTFHFECADIVAKDTADENIALKAGDKIVFTYTSTLNEQAKLGVAGNPNEMYIEFSNDPYGDGTSETPKDKVIVFTFKVNVDKYTTVDEKEVALPGAGFTLYKEVKDAETEGAKTGAEIKAELAQKNPSIKAGALKADAYYVIAAEVVVDANGSTFGFNGVDDGNYVLVETQIPDGYNAWNAAEFTIDAEHDEESVDPQLTELTGGNLFSGEVSTGILSGKVENNSGVELPEAGGMGTTIFYIVGGLLAVAAVVLLITKKRMNSAE